MLDNVVCLESIKRNSDDDYSVSSLVLGTELKKLYILDVNGYNVEKKVSKNVLIKLIINF